MNPRAKGRKIELMAIKELEFNDWTCYGVPPSRKFSKNIDIFHLFDIFCVRKGKFKLIQVKTNQTRDLKPYYKFLEENRCEALSIEVWVWYDKGKSKTWKGWRKVIIK